MKLLKVEKSEPLETQFIGETQIKLDRLRDQKKHEETLEFISKEKLDHPIGGLFSEIQWIYSRVKFLNDVVKKWDTALQEDEATMGELEERLKDLRLPFQNTLEAIVQSISVQQQIFLTHQMYPQEYDIKDCLVFFWYVVCILGIFQMFIKQDFTTICLGIYGAHVTLSKPPIKPKKITMSFLGIIGAILHDIIWLITLGSDWKNITVEGGESPSLYKMAETTLKHTAYTITIVLLILKVFFNVIKYKKTILIFMMFYVYIQNENLLSRTGLAAHHFEQTDDQKRDIQIVNSNVG